MCRTSVFSFIIEVLVTHHHQDFFAAQKNMGTNSDRGNWGDFLSKMGHNYVAKAAINEVHSVYTNV